MQKKKLFSESIDVIDASSNILSCINPIFAGITLVTYSVRKVMGLCSDESIINRLKKFEMDLKNKKIDINDFKNKVSDLSEHDKYVVANNLYNILLTCIPETLDIYISLLVDYIMSNDNNKHDELCEIISQLNKSDLTLLQLIKEYQLNGDYKHYDKAKEKHNNQIKKYYEQKENEIKNRMNTQAKEKSGNGLMRIRKISSPVLVDRGMFFEKNTIFWSDFKEYYNIIVNELGTLLMMKGKDENNNDNDDLAYIAKSILKLQGAGLLELDFIDTIGNSNMLNIDRFHVTLIGQKILEYIEI